MTDTYICIDLETTGLNPKTDKIIEIGAVKVIGGVVKDTFSAFVNPGRLLEERVSELTGITNAQLENANAPRSSNGSGRNSKNILTPTESIRF